ncbi:alpha/beta hydrolase [Nocardioides sp. YIM 152588]|uniref:alpha/beta hydrolase n=1 Tax=Nocardioides sp. YIM 152588 TaxID=3158259 RepID=UPI0032E3C9A2
MRSRSVVAVFVVGLMLLAASLGTALSLVGDDEPDASPGGARSSTTTPVPGDGVPQELLPFYTQRLAWSGCGERECAELEVPIDYTDPTAGSVRIAVERAAATGDRIGSMVVNPGGPGAPGTDVATNAEGYFGRPLLAAYDVVGFDPRGTGDSDPVDCLTDAELDAYVAEDPAPDTKAEERDFVAGLEDFWAGCQERSDELVGHVSTVEVARDMDVLRAALGEEQLTYFGYSYGTKLGATYAELFPDRVGRFVLDGAIDPTLSSRDGSLSQAAGFETALRAYVSDCVDGGNCFLGNSVQEGLDTISGLLDDIDDRPLPTEGDRELSVGNAFYGVVFPLYYRELWSALDQGLSEALAGDGSTLLVLSDYYGSREPDGSYADNGLEVISVVNCLDDPEAIDPADVESQYPAFTEASPTFGEVFAWGLTGCSGIPFTATDEPDLVIDGAGAAPIVVIGTTRDPATPYEEAVALAEQLESGVLITRDGDGHTGYNKGNACVDGAVHAYLVDGEVPEDGLQC